MNEDERKLKEGYLAALRAGVESDVKASIFRCVGERPDHFRQRRPRAALWRL